jgi:RNA polymerase sigma-B factor
MWDALGRDDVMNGSSTQPTADRARRKPDPAARAERARRTEELFRQVAETDDPVRRQALLDEVVLINRCVAQAVAARYRGRGVPQEDLEQSAFEGLVRAVHKFDPTVSPDLLTYAVPTMRGMVRRWFRDQSWMVRPPRSVQEMQWKVSRSASMLAQELGREPSSEEIRADIGCTADDVSEAVQALGCFQPSSLDRLVASVHNTTLGDVMADQQEHIFDAVDARAILGPAFRCLPARDRRVLYLRFFEERSQKEIGAELGITQTQVSRLLNRILRDLRQQLQGEGTFAREAS